MAEGAVKYTMFWKKDSPFSQWHPSKFNVNGVTYHNAEQYMMHQKALLFGDQDVAAQITGTADPRKIKSLGRKVHDFDEDKWEANRIRIITEGNTAKFSQNDELRVRLFETKGTILVEASPVDTIYGIGLPADHADAQHRSQWRGQNLLGFALTDVRDRLLAAQDTGQR